MLPLFILRVVDLQRVSANASKESVETKEKGPVYPYGVAIPESLEAVMEINKDEHRASQKWVCGFHVYRSDPPPILNLPSRPGQQQQFAT